MKSEYRLMHTNDAENLMLCNLYIIKLEEHSQMVRVCNHPLRKIPEMKKKNTCCRYTSDVSDGCKVEVFCVLTKYCVSQFVRDQRTRSAEAYYGAVR